MGDISFSLIFMSFLFSLIYISKFLIKNYLRMFTYAYVRLQRLKKHLKRSLLPKWRMKLEENWHWLLMVMMLVVALSLSFRILSYLPSIMCFLVLQLETAVANEMSIFTEEWEGVLDELEIESAHLLVCFSLQLSSYLTPNKYFNNWFFKVVLSLIIAERDCASGRTCWHIKWLFSRHRQAMRLVSWLSCNVKFDY